MKCEECGKNDAVFHFVTVFDNETRERSLCTECMSRYKRNLPGLDIQNLAGLLNNLLGGKKPALEEEIDQETLDLACERCGTTYNAFRKQKLVGCAECYTAFDKQLSDHLIRKYGSAQHIGRTPGKLHNETSIRISIERLKAKQRKAIEEEAYEEAAKYRDQIRAFSALLQQDHAEHMSFSPTLQYESEDGIKDE